MRQERDQKVQRQCNDVFVLSSSKTYCTFVYSPRLACVAWATINIRPDKLSHV